MAKRRARGANEGSIFQRDDGRWCGVVNVGFEGGKRKRKYLYGDSRTEVAEQLTKVLREKAQGLPVSMERQTVAQFLNRWLEDSARPRIRPRTYERFAELIRLHITPTLGTVRLEKLTPAHVQRLLMQKRQQAPSEQAPTADQLPGPKKKQRQGLSAQTVVSIRNVLRAALNQALRWGIVGRNVAALVDAPRIERPPVRVLSPEEARKLLDAARGERFEVVYTVGLALGLRRGELLGLRWEDVDLERTRLGVFRSLQRIGGKLQLTETKTPKSRRTLSLPQYAVRALRAHRARQLEERLAAGPGWQDTGLVFTSTTGGPIEPVTLHRHYKRLLVKVGLPPTRFHNLRHSAASLMLAQGVPLKTIQEILGHSSIAVTSGFYAHLGEELKREAADSMDRVLGDAVRTSQI